MKRFLTGLIAGVMLISSVSAAGTTFSDVKETDWFYSQVMAMTENGLFAGKGEIVNGVGTFAPNDTMTKAEFLTVVARLLYGEDNLKGVEGDAWWSVYYSALVNGGVITTDEFSTKDLNQPMTRQEMSLVAMRALNARGESAGDIHTYNVEASIPDSAEIGVKYKEYVLEAYSMGILCGKAGGSFDPQGTLKRSEATTVLYRIVEPSAREKVDFSTGAAEQTNTPDLPDSASNPMPTRGKQESEYYKNEYLGLGFDMSGMSYKSDEEIGKAYGAEYTGSLEENMANGGKFCDVYATGGNAFFVEVFTVYYHEETAEEKALSSQELYHKAYTDMREGLAASYTLVSAEETTLTVGDKTFYMCAFAIERSGITVYENVVFIDQGDYLTTIMLGTNSESMMRDRLLKKFVLLPVAPESVE